LIILVSIAIPSLIAIPFGNPKVPAKESRFATKDAFFVVTDMRFHGKFCWKAAGMSYTPFTFMSLQAGMMPIAPTMNGTHMVNCPFFGL
jgi:hypothetical protein